MSTAAKFAVLVAGAFIFVLFCYCGELGYYLQSATFKYLNGSNACQVLPEAETSVNNMSSTLVQLDGQRNKTLFIKDYTLNDDRVRLGNQMFRYASLLGIARAQGRELIVSSGSDLEKTFKLQHVTKDNNASNKWRVITEVSWWAFDRRLMNLSLTDMKIKGYLQSYKYFSNVADEVRQEFTFHDSIANEAATIVHDVYIRFKGSLVVGVHVRRGDFKSKWNNQLGYVIPQKSYFSKAFNLLKSKFPGRNITFLVVSDDLPWCKENLVGTSTIIAPPAAPAVHIAVLAKCDHVIITSGTFSWWGGWLCGGYVVYFSGFMMKNTTFGKTFSPQDYYPSLWIGLGN